MLKYFAWVRLEIPNGKIWFPLHTWCGVVLYSSNPSENQLIKQCKQAVLFTLILNDELIYLTLFAGLGIYMCP